MTGTPVLDMIQVNMPYGLLMEHYLPLVLKERMHLEIGFDCFVLDQYNLRDFRETAARLSDAGLRITFHAPFYDLRPGALDRKIRDVTVERIGQLFELVPLFRPRSVVCHAAFERRCYVSHEREWLENSMCTWEPYVRLAGEMGTTLMLENVYEDGPDELRCLLEGLGAPLSGCSGDSAVALCFDTGHWNAFSKTPLDDWMETLGFCIGQLHLHDNSGSGDEHLPVGEGTFPFDEFFRGLNDLGKKPIITIEPHTMEDFRKSLENIIAMNLLSP